jgi:hypothetical protein
MTTTSGSLFRFIGVAMPSHFGQRWTREEGVSIMGIMGELNTFVNKEKLSSFIPFFLIDSFDPVSLEGRCAVHSRASRAKIAIRAYNHRSGTFVSLCARTATLPCVPMHSIRIVDTKAYA